MFQWLDSGVRLGNWGVRGQFGYCWFILHDFRLREKDFPSVENFLGFTELLKKLSQKVFVLKTYFIVFSLLYLLLYILRFMALGMSTVKEV